MLILNGNGADVAKHCVPGVPAKRLVNFSQDMFCLQFFPVSLKTAFDRVI